MIEFKVGDAVQMKPDTYVVNRNARSHTGVIVAMSRLPGVVRIKRDGLKTVELWQASAWELRAARYVVGFMFNPTKDAVLLIRKTHPEWQAGKLNGVGGRIDGEESALEAMQREFVEEVGINHADWKQFCVLGDARDWQIHFFLAYGPIGKAAQLTDEAPEIHCVAALPSDTIPNLHWLIPMALSMERETIIGFSITEVGAPVAAGG